MTKFFRVWSTLCLASAGLEHLKQILGFDQDPTEVSDSLSMDFIHIWLRYNSGIIYLLFIIR